MTITSYEDQTLKDSTPAVNRINQEDSTRLVLGFSPIEFIEVKELEMSGKKSDCKKGILVPMLYTKLPIYQDGLRPGDIILQIDGQCFKTAAKLLSYIKQKQSPHVVIDFKMSTGIRTIQSSLVSANEYHKITTEFLNTSTGSEGGILFFDAEETTKYIDRGDAYEYFKLDEVYKQTHWDFIEYRKFGAVIDYAKKVSKPVLIALFGSKSCCSYMSLSQKNYESLIADKKTQENIKDNFVSLLVLKPEAYQTYKDYNLDASKPALLVVNADRQLINYFQLSEETEKKALMEFLRQTNETVK